MPGLHLSSSGSLRRSGLPNITDWVTQLMARGSNAVYTTALVNGKGQVVDWPAHEDRLMRGAWDLHASDAALYASLVQSLEPAPITTPSNDQAGAAEAKLRAALKRYAWLSLREYLSTPDKVLPAMMYVLMRDEGATRNQPQGDDDLSLQADLPSVPVLLDVLVLPVPPLAGLQPGSSGGGGGVGCAGALVLVAGGPRQLAHVKHSAWMVQRQALDAAKVQAGATEVLLTDEGGCVLEGLITNFAAITTTGGGGGGGAGGEKPLRVQLHTADSGVLHGTALRRVLRAAENLGWEVVRHAPRLDARHTWQAAVITNSLRGVVPISIITCPPGSSADGQEWQLTLPAGGGGGGEVLVSALAQEATRLEAEGAWGLEHPSWI